MTRSTRSARSLGAPALLLALLVVLTGCFALPGFLLEPGPAATAGWEDDDDLGSVEVFGVDDGRLVPAATGADADIWDMFIRVITPAYAAQVMVQYRVGDAPESDTLAYVYQADDDGHWVLAANAAIANDTDLLLSTLIHEYAHVLSLQPSQFTDARPCRTLDLTEGCALASSALYAFDSRFWSGYRNAPGPENEDADIAWDFYERHEEDFVSDYAATNVVEDFAETFMTFVLEDEPDADTVIAEKLRFFWGYPEYVAIRERIRTEFGL